jgi:Cobalamin biosynthesis protein CobN and related Mg-chelatases
MVFFGGGVPAALLANFTAAKNHGVTLVGIMNDFEGVTDTPDFFDFRDTADLTINSQYSQETVENFFKLHGDSGRFVANEEIYGIYTENILMYLAQARNDVINEGTVTDQYLKDITDSWKEDVINIGYFGLGGSEDFGLLNQYSSYMNVTNIPAYDASWGPNPDVIEFAKNGGFAEQDLIIIDMVTASYLNTIDEQLEDGNKLEDIANDVQIVMVRSSGVPDYMVDGYDNPEYVALGTVTEQILILFARDYVGGVADDWKISGGIMPYGIYHPDLADKYYETLDDYLADYDYDDSKITVGIWFHKDYFTGGERARVKVIDELIRDLESKDVNVIAGFDVFSDTESGTNPMMKYYANSSGVLVNSVISIKDFALSYYDYDAGIDWLEELDVVVLKAIIASTGDSINGIPKEMLVYSTISPNRDGMGDFILLGNIGANGAETFDEQKDWLANRAIKWGDLNSRSNDSKKIVIMYYNYPPGKDGVGANYLNVIRSLAGADAGGINTGGVLREMAAAGYDVDYGFNGLPIEYASELNDTVLLDLIMQQGINVGSYAPGVLETMVTDRGDIADEDWWGATLVPVEDYKVWFDATIQNETMRKGIIDAWGEPWDYSKKLDSDQSGMTWEDENGKRFFVLPAIRFGNVYLMPQPDRALATEKAFAYHSGDIPPTHQYIAYYLWLNNEFKPQALINFGTHGTHEWLPGSAYGLSATDDLAPLLLQDIPNIYPYIVANVGEGLTAEYRGNALIIDHMTPPMIRSNLDSNDVLKEMETQIQAYFVGSFTGDTTTNVERQKDIVDGMLEIGLHEIINMDKLKRAAAEQDKDLETYLKDMPQPAFADFLREYLYDYIESIKENNLPYGMHVYGEMPNPDQIAAMVRAMWGVQYDNILHDSYYPGNAGIPSSDDDKIIDLTTALSEATTVAEMKTILEAAYPYADSIDPLKTSAKHEANHEAVIRFILGPVSDFDGQTNADDVIDIWVATGTDADFIAEVKLAYYAYTAEPTEAEIRANIKKFVEYCLNDGGTIDANLMNEALTDAFGGSKLDNTGIILFMTGEGRMEYSDRLKACGTEEMKSLMRALRGGYVTPDAGNDPIQNPRAIPTGKNFYGIDPDKFPTKAAWEVGKSLADQILIQYYEIHGEFPNTVAFSRFGTEFIRDEGALEACALYLMGVEPVWNPTTKNVEMKVNVLPYNELTVMIDGVEVPRPRVDIVYTTAGMRDAFGDKLKLLNIAVKAVAEYDGDPVDAVNHVKTNSQKLIDAGFADWAYMRCFAAELGNYEIGTGNLVSASGSWDDSQDIADMYLKNMGFLYGDDDTWGVRAPDFLKALLGNVDATVHASSSNLYDTLDNDDFFQYFGALNLAVKKYRDDNKSPEAFVADTTNVGRNAKTNLGKVYGLKEYLNKDMEARYLNEKWIKGMMESGYAGSTMYSEFVDNLFGWAATSDGELVSFRNWEAVYDIYVNDKFDLGLEGYFTDNPYAYQSITARMLEAMRHNLVLTEGLTGEQLSKLDTMQNTLLTEYMESVIQSGVSCCHHTCGNPKFSAFIDGQMSVLAADPDPENEALYQKYLEYKDILEQAVPPTAGTPAPSGGGSGFGMAALVSGAVAAPAEVSQSNEAAGQGYGTDGGQAGEDPNVVTGYEMTVLESFAGSVRNFMSNPSISASNIVVLTGIVFLVGAIFYGFRRRGV